MDISHMSISENLTAIHNRLDMFENQLSVELHKDMSLAMYLEIDNDATMQSRGMTSIKQSYGYSIMGAEETETESIEVTQIANEFSDIIMQYEMEIEDDDGLIKPIYDVLRREMYYQGFNLYLTKIGTNALRITVVTPIEHFSPYPDYYVVLPLRTARASSRATSVNLDEGKNVLRQYGRQIFKAKKYVRRFRDIGINQSAFSFNDDLQRVSKLARELASGSVKNLSMNIKLDDLKD